MSTALGTARKLVAHFGLAFDPAYRAALNVANDHGLIAGGRRSPYDLTPAQIAEVALVVFAAGSGLTKEPAFLAAIRRTGLAARLADLLEYRPALRESTFVFDVHGHGLRAFKAGEDASSIVVGLEVFHAPPRSGASCTIDGAALAAALAD